MSVVQCRVTECRVTEWKCLVMLCDTAAFQKKNKKESDAAYNQFPGKMCVNEVWNWWRSWNLGSIANLGGPGLSLWEEIALARYAAAASLKPNPRPVHPNSSTDASNWTSVALVALQRRTGWRLKSSSDSGPEPIRNWTTVNAMFLFNLPSKTNRHFVFSGFGRAVVLTLFLILTMLFAIFKIV